MELKRTIETILDLETGDQIETAILFGDRIKQDIESFKLRTKIE